MVRKLLEDHEASPDSRFLPIAWVGFLSLLPPLRMAVWGSGTSISGETFDGISMGFSVPVAPQRTPNPAWATGAHPGARWLWAPGAGDGDSVTPLGWPLSICWGGGSHPSAPWCLSLQPGRARGCRLRETPWLFQLGPLLRVILGECPLTVPGQGLRLARLLGQ